MVPHADNLGYPGAHDLPPSVLTLPDHLNLLLVCRTPSWSRAVRDAAAAIGGGPVAACDARDALARLAGTGTRYSHLLIEDSCADGLLNELAELTSSLAGAETAMLMLGGTAVPHPRVGVIRSASRQSVQRALMLRPPRCGSETPNMPLSELHDALTGSMIEARYQPIVSLADGKPFGLEALARLNHPIRGTLLPDRFVPQMEDAGLAARLTELVSARAFLDLGNPGLARHGLRITLNFPLDVLLRPDALDRLEQQRLAARIPAERVIVELTESRPVEDFATLRTALEHLRARGYRVTIDDVGPAVPCLAPLLDLPFTSLKLDKDLVKQVEQNPASADFLATTIAQAHQRGMAVVAEGVETIGIWNRMRNLGADGAQGFLVARPLPIAAVPVWLDAWQDRPAIG